MDWSVAQRDRPIVAINGSIDGTAVSLDGANPSIAHDIYTLVRYCHEQNE